MSVHEYMPRASSMGALMTNSRSKSDPLGATAKTEIEKALTYNVFGIRDELSSKQIEKGIVVEKESIELAADVFDWLDVDTTKPKIRLSNDYIGGEPDVLTKSVLADVKSSWNGSTFFPVFFQQDLKNKSYYYQMMSYLWLSGMEECELVYCLTNTPMYMIEDMVKRESWQKMAFPSNVDKDMDEIEAEVEERVLAQHKFDHIPNDKRVKRFVIKRDEQVIEQMIERIEICRKYYDQLLNLL